MPSITLPSGISIHYQDIGEQGQPTIILIMGLGAQMTVWPDSLVFGLANNGFRVIRFDNRDTGLSSQLDEIGSPSLFRLWLSKHLPIRPPTSYDLDDMAKDVVGLMAALKIKRAHLVGASMGGMIAKIVAAKHKKKVLSLTSIMSSSSYSDSPPPKLKVLLKLANRPVKYDREAAIRYTVKLNQVIASPAYPTSESKLRQQATLNVDRGYYPAGFKRQLAALTKSKGKRTPVKKIKAPTLIIHGTADPIIPASCGEQTAQLIKKSKLKLVQGMGHDFPDPLMAKVAKWITKHVKKAEKIQLKQQVNKTNTESL
jgi:pimeloyl-ACP methyl ester carboxylesterase